MKTAKASSIAGGPTLSRTCWRPVRERSASRSRRIGGRAFPVRHPHVALVIGLAVTSPEFERDHEIRFVLLDPDGGEIASGSGSVVAHGTGDGRDTLVTFSVDLWNLTFPVPGDYSVRILINGSERKRLPLVIFQAEGLPGMPETAEPPGGTPRFDA